LLTVWLFDDHLNRRTADEARAAGLDVISVRRIGLGVINLITCRV
jgi:dethiobiotin synthetase